MIVKKCSQINYLIIIKKTHILYFFTLYKLIQNIIKKILKFIRKLIKQNTKYWLNN